MAKKKNQNPNGKLVLKNKPATFHYAIEEKLSAGMVLIGSEIKSIKNSKVSFADSYCHFVDDELWVKSLNIAQYENAGYAGHIPTRDRKLLLNKRELKKWRAKIKEKGYTIVPLSIFINEDGRAKMEIGLGKGKKLYDKRESIKEKDLNRNKQIW